MPVISSRFSLYKRSNSFYYIGYYQDGRRKWKSTGATVKTDALKALTQFKELLHRRARSIPLQQFVSEFLAYAEANYSPKTLTIYRACLGRFSALAKNVSLEELSSEHIDKFKSERLRALKIRGKEDETVRPVSVNVELRTLRSAFNIAKRWRMIRENPCDGVPPARVPDIQPAYLRAEDFEKLTNCMEENWLREVVMFAVLTGMRRGEILNLRWCDVDLSRKLVQIQSSATFRTKLGRRRSIPLSETAMYLLNARYGKSTSEYVFTLNDKQINAGWVTHLFKRYVRRAGLNDGLRFHSLRHTFATNLVKAGVNLHEVQKLLGHSSIKVTEGYSHLAASELHAAVNKVSLN